MTREKLDAAIEKLHPRKRLIWTSEVEWRGGVATFTATLHLVDR